MHPDPMREEEVEGVLNPGAARGPDGNLYLFPRLVGRKNYSRIGIARVLFGENGIPNGVERLGVALEPEQAYELRPQEGTGGCEDPRVTYVEPLRRYVMTYVAWGSNGPRVALAISENCLEWQRLGLVDFQPDVQAHYDVHFNEFDNKDAAFAPVPLQTHDGRLILAMFHRPQYTAANAPKGVEGLAPSIWVSGCELEAVKRDIRQLCVMNHHERLVQPVEDWEVQRIGVGTPPVLTPLGYMIVYHGVSGQLAEAPGEVAHVNYEAGLLVFRRENDRLFFYRSPAPILIPELKEETSGVVDNVVFPTGIDEREHGVYDVYYGMADKYIGAVRLWLPKTLQFKQTDTLEVARERMFKT
ncbi:MAG: glycosidase [Candidatus Eremiobacteraeota bacterium]|nr:glycosidase [Candidatus Eremiobacteraeota bacterium]